MKKAIITAKKTVEYWESPIPEIGEHQVLVRVTACGLCTMEQRFYTGTKEQYPFSGGHEICGIAEKVGSKVGSDVRPGDKVVVAAITRCGDCYFCQRGMDNMCANGGDSAPAGQLFGPGGLSEYMVAEGYQVYKVNPALDDGVATLAEPVACVLRSLEKGRVKPSDTVLVTGAGVMGLLHVILGIKQGLSVFITEVDEKRKQKAAELGATVLDPSREDVVQAVKERTGGRGVEAVFYTAGGVKAAQQGIDCLAKGATIVFYGAIYPNMPMEISPNKMHYDEIVMTGLVSTTKESFRQSAKMLSEGLVDVTALISERFPFEQTGPAFERAVSPETYRVVVEMKG